MLSTWVDNGGRFERDRRSTKLTVPPTLDRCSLSQAIVKLCLRDTTSRPDRAERDEQRDRGPQDRRRVFRSFINAANSTALKLALERRVHRI